MKRTVGDILEVKISKRREIADCWWNNFVGITVEVEIEAIFNKVLLLRITDKSLKFLKDTFNSNVIIGRIVNEYVEFLDEVSTHQPIEENEKFEVHPKRVKLIREVRIFRATKDLHRFNVEKDKNGISFFGTKILYTFFRVGDIFEETFNCPNALRKIGVPENEQNNNGNIYGVNEINMSHTLLESFELVKTIQAKDSEYFESQKKSLGQQFKRTRKVIADANQKLNELRFFLEITDED